jgi:hypothetical protein
VAEQSYETISVASMYGVTLSPSTANRVGEEVSSCGRNRRWAGGFDDQTLRPLTNSVFSSSLLSSSIVISPSSFTLCSPPVRDYRKIKWEHAAREVRRVGGVDISSLGLDTDCPHPDAISADVHAILLLKG